MQVDDAYEDITLLTKSELCLKRIIHDRAVLLQEVKPLNFPLVNLLAVSCLGSSDQKKVYLQINHMAQFYSTNTEGANCPGVT